MSVDQRLDHRRARAAPRIGTHAPGPDGAGPGRDAAFVTHTVPAVGRDKAAPGRFGAHNTAAEGARGSEFLAVWRAQNPSGRATNPSFQPPGAHKSPRVAAQIEVSRRLAPTNPLGWGRECQCAATWRPQDPSGGGTNRGFAAFGAHKSPPAGTRVPVRGRLAPTNPLGWRNESEFRVVWYPQIPSGGDANASARPPGAHKTPRVAARIGVSRRLAPTNPLAWRQESEFRVVWRPHAIPASGDENVGIGRIGAHKTLPAGQRPRPLRARRSVRRARRPLRSGPSRRLTGQTHRHEPRPFSASLPHAREERPPGDTTGTQPVRAPLPCRPGRHVHRAPRPLYASPAPLSSPITASRTSARPVDFFNSRANQTMQRTGAGRFAQRRIQRHRRLAPVGDLSVGRGVSCSLHLALEKASRCDARCVVRRAAWKDRDRPAIPSVRPAGHARGSPNASTALRPRKLKFERTSRGFPPFAEKTCPSIRAANSWWLSS